MRLQREAEGLAAVVARAPGGKEQKVQGDALRAVERLFARGATLCEVQAARAKRKIKAAIGTLSGLRTKWRGRQASGGQTATVVEGQVASSRTEEPTPATAAPPAGTFSQVSAGGTHTVAASVSGRVWGWGDRARQPL